MASANEQATYFPNLFIAFALLGIGAGTSFMPLLTIALAEVPAEDAGLASGMVNLSMQLSAALGLAILGSISTEHSGALVAQGYSLSFSLTAGYQLAFTLAALCVSVGFVAAQIVLRPAAVTAPETLEIGRIEPSWQERDAA